MVLEGRMQVEIHSEFRYGDEAICVGDRMLGRKTPRFSGSHDGCLRFGLTGSEFEGRGSGGAHAGRNSF